MHRGLRNFAEELHATLARLLAYLGALAILAVAAAELFDTPIGMEAAAPPVVKSDWIDVGKPFPSFELSLPELAESEPRYSIRRHADGGGRKDVISFGDTPGSLAQVMIEIYRPARELDRFADPQSEIVARAAELGPVDSVQASEAIASKFGPFWTLAFRARAPGGARQCLGFVRAFEDPRLQIAGWSCKPERDVVDRGLIACALDRLALLAAGSDLRTGELFAVAERDRTFCGQRDPLLAATPRRDWVSARPEPKLRGRVAGR